MAIEIQPPTGQLPVAIQSAEYTQFFDASGGVAPYTWSVSAGYIPDGMTLDPDEGVLYGIPIFPGVTDFSIEATDSVGATGSNPYTLTVIEGTTQVPQVRQIPPVYPDDCLPEGRKIVSTNIQFNQSGEQNGPLPFAPQINNLNSAPQWIRADVNPSLANVALSALQGMIVSVSGLLPEQFIIIDTGDGAPVVLGADGGPSSSITYSMLNVYAHVPVYASATTVFRIYLLDISGEFGNVPGIMVNIGLTNFKVLPFVTWSTAAWPSD